MAERNNNISRRKFIGKSALTALSVSALNTLGSVQRSTESLSNLQSRHPSLHFDSSRLKDLRNNKEETHLKYVQFLYKWIEENKNWNPPFITGVDGEEVQLEECAAFLTNAALGYCLSQNKEYLNLSVKWALKMCEIPKTAITNYGIGIYAAGLARAYDWLYHDIKSKDREKIQTTIADIAGRMYEGSRPGVKNSLWWSNAFIHHDHWIAVGGYGEAALSLIGEVPEAVKWANGAKEDFEVAFSWLADDGAWYEGVADWCYTMAPLLWFYGAWQSVTGENLHNKPWIQNTSLYRQYHRLTDTDYIYLNDSFRSGRYSTSGAASCHLLRRLASLFKDGNAQWLAEQDEIFDMKPSPKGVYQAPYENLSFGGNPKEYPYPASQIASWNILWYDSSIKPIPPDNLPKAKHFKNQDIVIMRTGWSDQDAVLSLTCAPLAGHLAADRVQKGEKVSNISHAHCDPSSFTLFAKGQYFIIPAGYARRSSNFQNVISFNGADFVADPALKVRITAFRDEPDFSYTVADATNAFHPHLGVESYHRHILLLGKKWLFLFDDIIVGKAGMRTSGVNRFSWTVHSEPLTHQFSIKGNKVIWQSKGERNSPLSMFVLEPQQYAWERELFQSSSGKPMMEALHLTKPEWYNGKLQLLTAWTWEENSREPKLIKTEDFVAVSSDEDSAVGFSLSKKIPSELKDQGFNGKKLILFGTDPENPDNFIIIKS